MRKLYRIAGISARHILGEHYCFVVELQNVKTGALYHYHKDFPVTTTALTAFRSGMELWKFTNNKVPAGWELQEEVEEIIANAS